MTSAVAIAWTTLLLAHELPDEVVDRGIQLAIAKNRIEVQYEVGMSLRTVEAELRKQNKLPADWQPQDLESPRAAELMPIIRQHYLEQLAEGLQITVNDQLVQEDIKGIRVEPSAKQHTLLRATYAVPLKSSRPQVRLQFRDNNFPSERGWLRIAAKSRGPVAITKSSTKSVLVRLSRDLELPETPARLEAKRRIEVEFQIPDELVVKATGTPAPAPSSSSPDDDIAETETTDRPGWGWFAGAFALLALIAVLSYAFQRRGS